MSVPGASNPLLLSSAAAGGGGFTVQRSVRFNSGDSAYLTRTPPTSGNRVLWTWSGWVKRTKHGNFHELFGAATGGTDYFALRFNNADNLDIFDRVSSGDVGHLTTTAVYRDLSAWYHILYVWDTNNATAADKRRLYVNGIRVTDLAVNDIPPNGSQSRINSGLMPHTIGRYDPTASLYLDGYLAEINFLDGLAPSTAVDDSSGSVTGVPNAEYLTDFGEFDATTGVWNPVAYTGSYGTTTGFHLDFADNSSNLALGLDSSGEGNNWTPININAVIPSTSVIFPASNSPSTVELLVVGGGGGGGYVSGGGAGGFRTTTSYSVSAGATYNVKVGLGGGGGSLGGQGADGGSSYFDSFTSAGGGGGGYTGATGNGRPGGSGGGGGTGSGGAGNTPVTSPSQGNNGGNGSTDGATYTNGGGGGGASATGGNANSTAAGNGGNGTASSITGVSVYYAGGGGGGNDTTGKTAGTGGLGGGGNGAKSGATAGTDGLGGGGGGEQYSPKSGGSGVVILRYPDTFDNLTVSSGLTYTLTTTGGYKIYSITASSALTDADIDSFRDSPTNGTQTDTGAGNEVSGNYATLNPLAVSGATTTISNGNLQAFGDRNSYATIALPVSGKWYWEVTPTTGSAPMIGVAEYVSNSTASYTNTSMFYYGVTGEKYNAGVNSAYGATYTLNDVIGVAVDIDSGTVEFYKNGSPQGSISYDATGLFPASTTAGGSATYIFNFGQRAFTYQNAGVDRPSAAFKALCTANITAPTISKPRQYMDVLLWTGDDAPTRDITGLSFQPELVWLKSRSVSNDHNLFDSVRGAENTLISNSTAVEVNQPVHGWVSNFISGGFSVTGGSLGDVNYLSRTYVAWNWDAGTGSPVSNTDGTIPSSVQANISAGFSIVTYTGNGTSGETVGHGLGVSPQMVIVKNRDDSLGEWAVYHSYLTANYVIWLNYDFAQGPIASRARGAVSSTSPSTFTCTQGTVNSVNVNESGDNYVAYCFAPVEGYSAFGSYIGNGSTAGPFIYTGFRPAYLLVKKSNNTGYWLILDKNRSSYNVADNKLAADLSDDENSSNTGGAGLNAFDFLSNGFKARSTTGSSNVLGDTYIWAAFAENPFKYARAR